MKGQSERIINENRKYLDLSLWHLSLMSNVRKDEDLSNNRVGSVKACGRGSRTVETGTRACFLWG